MTRPLIPISCVAICRTYNTGPYNFMVARYDEEGFQYESSMCKTNSGAQFAALTLSRKYNLAILDLATMDSIRLGEYHL